MDPADELVLLEALIAVFIDPSLNTEIKAYAAILFYLMTVGNMGASSASPSFAGNDLTPQQYLEMRFSRGETVTNIAADIGCHRQTLQKHLKSLGVSRFHSILPEFLDQAITRIVATEEHGRNWGYRMVQSRFRVDGIRVPERHVRAALLRMDPEAVAMRHINRLWRGHYTILKPMLLWHIDCKPPICQFEIKDTFECLLLWHH
jgi:hypothetical protein